MNDKKSQVIQMLAEVKNEATQKLDTGTHARKKRTLSTPKKTGVELVYIKLESHEGLADVLTAIRQTTTDKE